MDVLAALVAGERVTERDFDLLFPPLARKLARVHWTPLAAAVRAAALLVDRPGVRVLDVGSGGGKLCLVGALTTPGVFTGVERDGELVAVARSICREHRVERARFVHGDALAMDFGAFDALYFFNPFANDVGLTRQGLETRHVDEAEFVRVVAAVAGKIAATPSGTRIVTYHGFGGTMPAGVVERHAEVIGPGVLQLWIRE